MKSFSFTRSTSVFTIEKKRNAFTILLTMSTLKMEINAPPTPPRHHVSADRGSREVRTKLGSYLFISRFAEMFIGKQHGKVERFD